MSIDLHLPQLSIVSTALDTALGYGRLLRAALPRRRLFAAGHNDDRLLLLVREFAPAIAGGVYRPAALARYAQRAGWKVTVVTVAESTTPSRAGLKLLDYVGAEVQIVRIAPPRLRPSVRLFPAIDGGMITALDMLDAVRRRFNDDVPRTIVASGPPFCSFVAALLLARHGESRLVLEYHDEWTECPFDFVSKSGADARWEAWCLALGPSCDPYSGRRSLQRSCCSSSNGPSPSWPAGARPGSGNSPACWHFSRSVLQATPRGSCRFGWFPAGRTELNSGYGACCRRICVAWQPKRRGRACAGAIWAPQVASALVMR